MKKVIVFDLDGTLVNTIYDIGSSMNKALVEHGFKEHALDEYYNFIGEGVIVLTRKAIVVETTDEIMQSVLNRYNQIYHENSMVLSKPYPNMIEVLDQLLSKGYKLAVISNKPDVDTQSIVKHYFGDRFFYIAGWKKEVERKPSPMSMEIFLKENNLTVDEIAYVGDSRYDAKFSINIGCDYYLFEYGYDKKEVISTFTPNAFLKEAKDLLKYF